MFDFQCHYRVETWQTARYFDFVKEFLIAAQDRDDSDDCDPPPCPTTPHTVTTEEYLKGEYDNTRSYSLVHMPGTVGRWQPVANTAAGLGLGRRCLSFFCEFPPIIVY